MATKHLHVLLPSNRWTDHQVEELSAAVIAGVPGNKNFSNSPVDPAALQAAATDFHVSIGAAAHGGVHQTADKNKKKHDLIVMLRKIGLYVQSNCNEEISTLTSSGFQAASTVRALGPLPKPVIDTVDNGHTTQLLVTVQKVAKAKAYELYIAPVTGGSIGTWQAVGTFTKSRNMPANGLTPGGIYAFRVRAVGGTKGYSDYSDLVTHMSM